MQTSRKSWQILGPVLLFLIFQLPSQGQAQVADQVTAQSRCPVCGMFVAKHPNWISRIDQDGKPALFFDGVKDMMVYYFTPEKFGGQKLSDAAQIMVKDYYTLDWIDGRKAYYVGGSDVYGPMGNELIPFSSEAAAKSFQTDHKGKDVFSFDQITEQYVETLRHGQMMR
jgi:copper chaperone NosL